MKITLSSVFALSLITSVAQTTITLNESAIQDAYVWDYLPTTNIGNAGEFEIYAWTYSGTPTIRRGFMQFDLSSLPDNALIQEATLTLYNNPTSTSTSGQHQQLSGSNEIIIQRVLENWQETTVTWDNQPSSSISGTMTIPASQSPNQDYVIDITQFATDWQTNPSQNFGLLIRLEIESYYRSVILASSENADVNLRPHLDITYPPQCHSRNFHTKSVCLSQSRTRQTPHTII